MTTTKVILCPNQGGAWIPWITFPPGIFKRPNVCKLGRANSEYKFPSGRGGSLGEKEGEVGSGEASKLHYCSDRPQDNELCRASRPCSRATKARQAQRKCATAAHSLRYPQQTLVRRLRHGDNNRRKRRTEGGKRGAFGGKGGSGSRGAFQVTYRFSSLKPSTPFPEFIFDLESGYLVLES